MTTLVWVCSETNSGTARDFGWTVIAFNSKAPWHAAFWWLWFTPKIYAYSDQYMIWIGALSWNTPFDIMIVPCMYMYMKIELTGLGLLLYRRIALVFFLFWHAASDLTINLHLNVQKFMYNFFWKSHYRLYELTLLDCSLHGFYVAFWDLIKKKEEVLHM